MSRDSEGTARKASRKTFDFEKSGDQPAESACHRVSMGTHVSTKHEVLSIPARAVVELRRDQVKSVRLRTDGGVERERVLKRTGVA